MRRWAATFALALLSLGSPAWAANNKAPTVAMSAPASGATFAAPATITISATATDADGTVAKVEFYRDGTLIGTRTAIPYSVTWTNVAAGNYSLTARATDNAGASRTSAAVSIVVTGPKLLITYPPDGATIFGGAVTVSGTFSGDATSTVLVDNGSSSVLATLSGNEYRAFVPVHDGPTRLRAAVARPDRTSDSASVTVLGHRHPLIAFTAPASSLFDAAANIDLAVDAVSPTGAIDKVEFLRNGAPLGVATVPPYRVVWTNAASGTHLVSAIATDANGYTGTTSRTITIAGPNAPPSVALTSPSPGAAFTAPATVSMTAQASDADGTVAMVEFLQNGSVVGVTNVAPYAATWSGVGAGAYSLTARATDNRSGVTISAPVTISVAAPNSPPVVSLTSPIEGSGFVAPAAIPVAAAAADADGSVARVEFFEGTGMIGTSTAPPYAITWTGAGPGTYALTAKATDNAGAVTTSAPVAISVNENRAPTVNMTSPVQGASFAAPATIALVAAASDADGMVASVEFFDGSTFIGAASAPPYTHEWTGVAPGAYSVTARAIDDRGAIATSPAVSVSVVGSALAIDSPADGATIHDDTVTVSGTLLAPPNSGVTVNGIVAAISGDRFHANGVKLEPGVNELSAVLTTPEEQTGSHAISVTSTGPGPVRISASPTHGLAPLTVVFDAQAQVDVSIHSVEIDSDGDGVVDRAVTAPPWSAEITYMSGGALVPAVRVTHGSGITTRTVPVVVIDEAQLDQTLRAVWIAMKNALAAGDKDRALLYLDQPARLRYGPVFDVLLPSMSQIVATFSDLQSVTLSDALGEYAVNRTIDGEDLLFLIYFGRSADGVWRLGSM